MSQNQPRELTVNWIETLKTFRPNSGISLEREGSKRALLSWSGVELHTFALDNSDDASGERRQHQHVADLPLRKLSDG